MIQRNAGALEHTGGGSGIAWLLLLEKYCFSLMCGGRSEGHREDCKGVVRLELFGAALLHPGLAEVDSSSLDVYKTLLIVSVR